MPCTNRECKYKRKEASQTFSEIFQFEPTYNHLLMRVFLSEDEQKPLPCLNSFASFDTLIELGRKQLRLAAAKYVDLKYKDASPKAKQEIIAWYICAVPYVFQLHNFKPSIHRFITTIADMWNGRWSSGSYVLGDVEGNQLTALIGAVFKAGRKDTGGQRCYDVLEKHVFPCIEGKVSEGNSEMRQNYANIIQLAFEAGRTNTSDSYVDIDCSLGKFSDKLALLGGIESFRLFVPTKTEDVGGSLRIIRCNLLTRKAISVKALELKKARHCYTNLALKLDYYGKVEVSGKQYSRVDLMEEMLEKFPNQATAEHYRKAARYMKECRSSYEYSTKSAEYLQKANLLDLEATLKDLRKNPNDEKAVKKAIQFCDSLKEVPKNLSLRDKELVSIAYVRQAEEVDSNTRRGFLRKALDFNNKNIDCWKLLLKSKNDCYYYNGGYIYSPFDTELRVTSESDYQIVILQLEKHALQQEVTSLKEALQEKSNSEESEEEESEEEVPNKSQSREQVDNLLELLLHRSTLSVEVDREYTWFCSKTAGVLVQEVKEVIEREASKVGMQQTCVVVSGSQAMHTSVRESDVDLVVSCDTTTKQSELAKKLKNISEFSLVSSNTKKGADIIAVKYKHHNFDISIAVQSGNEISASLTQAELKWWEDIRKTYPDIEKVVVLLKAWKNLNPNRNKGLSKSLKGAAITCLVVGCCKETCAVNKRVNVLTVLRKSLGKLVDMQDNKFPRQIKALYEPYDDLTKAMSKKEWNAVGMAAKEQLDSWGM